ncbi:MAG: PilC/PilY family type IV pilus protein, partial [Proteobacteria bacterium]|nr:PilC/PilY family type IV pilus protein [Pseudomonadota bacterium]
ANIMIMLDNSGSMNWALNSSSASSLDHPIDVAVDSSGNIYVLEYFRCRVVKYNSSGTFIKAFGSCGQGNDQFLYPHAITISGSEIFIANKGKDSIDVKDLDGNFKRRLLIRPPPLPSYWVTRGVAVSGNYLYISHNEELRVYNKNSSGSNGPLQIFKFQSTKICGESQRGGGAPAGIDVSNDGTKLVVVCPPGTGGVSQALQVYTLSGGMITGAYTSVAGTGLQTSTGKLYQPADAVFDSNNNIYVTDPRYNFRVTKFTSSYVYSAQYGAYSTTTPFYYPYGIGKDSSDNIYVADLWQNKIYKLNSSLTSVTTIAGSNRMEVAKSVIKKIVSNTELTSKANFGLMEWGWNFATSNGGLRIRVPISSSGAKTIFTNVDGVFASGGTYLNNALILAKSYFAGSAGYPSPVISGASCQLNYLIVISDGEWADPTGVVRTTTGLTNQTPSIKTFAVGLALGSSSSNYANLAVAGGTKVPLYASNEQELLASLTDAIKQVISSTLTFTAPTVTSEITKDNFIYQSTFSYAPKKQWEGSLKKYKLNTDSSIGNLEWDAGTKLNSKSASSRQLWTVGLSGTGLNNFTTTYRSELKNLFQSSLTSSDAQVDKLINFVRGVDTYDQDADNNITEERHKLSDIYHSQISIVGPPASSTTYKSIYEDAYYRSVNGYTNFPAGGSCGARCADRREILLAGSNAGILHAFDSSSGEELWGFIPPSMLNKLPKMISSTSNVTNAIFGVDGSPVVKDIYYGGKWRTIALTGLGRGGNSYFALDISNPNSPTHLFTIENDDSKKVVNFWNSSGNLTSYLYGTVSAASNTKDYSKLGEAWSTPRIIRVRINNVDKWVAVFGGGFNGGVNPNLGSAVFVMDLENSGDLLKKIDLTDKANAIPNSVPSDLVVVTANSTSKAEYYGAMVYVPDYEGKITKINLTSAGTLYESTQLFDVESSTTNGRYILNGAETTINSNKLWLYFGTGDSEKLGDQISGAQNRVYGIKDVNFPNFVALSRSGDISNCKTAPNCPAETDLGWYVDLVKSQKVTASPTIDVDRVYFPIYEPTSDINRCGVGNAILRALSRNCGNALFNANMGQGVLSKVVKKGSNLIVGIAGKANTQIKADDGTVFTAKDNVIIGKSTSKSPIGGVQLELWKENY